MNTNELDEQIAEKIFGWKWIDHGMWAINFDSLTKTDQLTGMKTHLVHPDLAEAYTKGGFISYPYEGILQYSSNITLALEVLEELKKQGWWFQIVYNKEGYTCYIYKKEDLFENDMCMGSDDNSMLKAIALAIEDLIMVRL